jgi:non-canonical purine NTP pyrophosphatase (RdgB/HAM1 family)
MKKLLIATRRKGKLAEIKEILKDLNFKLLTLEEISFPPIEPKEDGSTFSENAEIKARFYGKKTGLLTLADDSGLRVKALPHKLGLKTKRYAPGTDRDRYQQLLKEMENIPAKRRKAQFVAAVCLFNPKINQFKIEQGFCQGKIAQQAKGKRGFGYDPIFIVKSLNKHFAELSLEEKNNVSHRAKAIRKIKKYLK